MILTQKSLLEALQQEAIGITKDGPLGGEERPGEEDPHYNKASMWAILVSSTGLALSGAAASAYFAFQGRVLLVFLALILVLVGFYLTLSALREKWSLDLIAKLIETLSAESKQELVMVLIQSNSNSQGGILQLIESILNTFFTRGQS
ncbi:MAG: hypothetical protein AAFY15_04090 [Cyanobacteria bacterium J06648_11]